MNYSTRGDNLPPLRTARWRGCPCNRRWRAIVSALFAGQQQNRAGHEHAAPMMRIPTFAVSSMLVIPLLLAGQTAAPDQTPANGLRQALRLNHRHYPQSHSHRQQLIGRSPGNCCFLISEITFRSSHVQKVADGQWKVDGDLSLHGVTKAVSLTVKHGRRTVHDTHRSQTNRFWNHAPQHRWRND